jgi:hypothetical protein
MIVVDRNLMSFFISGDFFRFFNIRMIFCETSSSSSPVIVSEQVLVDELRIPIPNDECDISEEVVNNIDNDSEDDNDDGHDDDVDDSFSPFWHEICVSGDIPVGRSGHTAVLYRDRYLYVFGGFDGNSCFADLYCLDLIDGVWSMIECSDDSDVPSGRASHSAVIDQETGTMYIFGGSGSHFGYTNKRDLYSYNIATRRWTLLSGGGPDVSGRPVTPTGGPNTAANNSSTAGGAGATSAAASLSGINNGNINYHPDGGPSARYGQSMILYKDGLYIWGGTHGTSYPTDMHRFCLVTKKWQSLVATGELPPGRYRHQAILVSGQSIEESSSSDFTRPSRFMIDECNKSVFASLRSPKSMSSSILSNDTIFIFGGSGQIKYGDIFAFDLKLNTWKRVIATSSTMITSESTPMSMLPGGGGSTRRHLQSSTEQRVASYRSSISTSTRQVLLDSNGLYYSIPTTAVDGGGRYAHSAVLLRTHGDCGLKTVVIFGGNDGERHNDVLAFDVETRNWSSVTDVDVGDGNNKSTKLKGVLAGTPAARDFHAAVGTSDGCSMFIFGGSNGSTRFSDVHQLCYSSRTVPSCSLASDLKTCLVECQEKSSEARSLCDVEIRCDGDQSIYAHAALLKV